MVVDERHEAVDCLPVEGAEQVGVHEGLDHRLLRAGHLALSVRFQLLHFSAS
jgi:hypothetical protein